MAGPWTKNVEEPFKKEPVASLNGFSTKDRIETIEDIVSTMAVKQIREVWTLLSKLDGETKDFVFAAQMLSKNILLGSLKLLSLNDQLDSQHITAAIVMTKLLEKDIEERAKEFGVPIDREMIDAFSKLKV